MSQLEGDGLSGQAVHRPGGMRSQTRGIHPLREWVPCKWTLPSSPDLTPPPVLGGRADTPGGLLKHISLEAAQP